MAKKKSKKVSHKKGTTHKKKDEGVSFVKLDNPLSTRKDILETAIDSAEILQHWENYKNLREKKLDNYKKVVLIMNKIEKEVNALKRHLPKMKEVKSLEKPLKSEIRETKTTSKSEIMHRSELDREISEIKSKLDSLKL